MVREISDIVFQAIAFLWGSFFAMAAFLTPFIVHTVYPKIAQWCFVRNIRMKSLHRGFILIMLWIAPILVVSIIFVLLFTFMRWVTEESSLASVKQAMTLGMAIGLICGVVVGRKQVLNKAPRSCNRE
jgi:hypothetical protein